VILEKALVLAQLHIIQSGARDKYNWRNIAILPTTPTSPAPG